MGHFTNKETVPVNQVCGLQSSDQKVQRESHECWLNCSLPVKKCEQIWGSSGGKWDPPQEIVTARREGCSVEVEGEDVGSCYKFVCLFRVPQFSAISSNVLDIFLGAIIQEVPGNL